MDGMDYITKYNLTGNCKVNIKAVIKDWVRIPHLWSISEYNNEFRLIRQLRKDSPITRLKANVSVSDAHRLINMLNLKPEASTIFRRAATWRFRGV